MQLRTPPSSHAAAVLAAPSTSHRSGRALASAPVAFDGGWAGVRPQAVTAGDDYDRDHVTSGPYRADAVYTETGVGDPAEDWGSHEEYDEYLHSLEYRLAVNYSRSTS